MDKTHTDYILEGLMYGVEKPILQPIFDVIRDEAIDPKDAQKTKKMSDVVEDENFIWLHEPIVIPKFLVSIARFANPF